MILNEIRISFSRYLDFKILTYFEMIQVTNRSLRVPLILLMSHKNILSTLSVLRYIILRKFYEDHEVIKCMSLFFTTREI